MKSINLLALFLLSSLTLSAQLSDEEVLLDKSNQPKRRHSFNSEILVIRYREKIPENKLVSISIDSNLIHLEDRKGFVVDLPIAEVKDYKENNDISLYFTLDNGDNFELWWDETLQMYRFEHTKWFKKFSKKKKYYPIIMQKIASA